MLVESLGVETQAPRFSVFVEAKKLWGKAWDDKGMRFSSPWWGNSLAF
jgi:hypothetical protein